MILDDTALSGDYNEDRAQLDKPPFNWKNTLTMKSMDVNDNE